MQDIHDIAPPVQVGMDSFYVKTALAVLAFLFFCALMYFLFVFFKKRKKGRQANILMLPAPPLPDKAALSELDRFVHLKQNHPRLFYFKLTEVLKRFTGKCFAINAPEMTSQEMLSALGPKQVDKGMFSRLRDFLTDSDSIKYARQNFDTGKMEKDEAFVREFVKVVYEKTSFDSEESSRENKESKENRENKESRESIANRGQS
ncbi:MAG: hypothetical protein U9P10_12260 [Thermodesulfobacteriota bacterium]|nr:hypothetical protein [Thermodesulfobacteriota bacterium]